MIPAAWKAPVSPAVLEQLGKYDSCAIANAIETFHVQLRNEGFTNESLCCRFPEFAPIVGYAVTLRVHSSNPPMRGGAYRQRTDWWDELEQFPQPRIIVIKDADRRPGVGAFVGEVHATMLQAFGCAGVITNGAVRDLPAVRRIGFQMFSNTVSVSHAYMHVVEVNKPVEVGGLRIEAGDLLHGDGHGIVRIPPQIAAELPGALGTIRADEARILEYCRSSGFSKEGLRQLLENPRL
jgi:regulator of RNase E activity RraA